MGRHHSAVGSEQSKTMCPTCPGGLTSQSRPCWSNATRMPFWTASFYTWNLGSIWVLLSFPEASLGVHFSREKSCRRPPQSLWNWVLVAREVGTNTWGWMSELTFQISKLHFSGCSCFFPFFPFDAERERNEDVRCKSQSSLSRQASDTSVHTEYASLHFTNRVL